MQADGMVSFRPKDFLIEVFKYPRLTLEVEAFDDECKCGLVIALP